MNQIYDEMSERWAELSHAYGAATDTWAQIHQLLENENYGEDPNDLLFGCLCHQGSIYSATYAAVPLVVNALETQSTNGKTWLYAFLGQVAISKDAAPIPEDLEPAYFRALEDAKSGVMKLVGAKDIAHTDYCYLISSVPALYGFDAMYEVVDWMLTAHEVCGLCKSCGEEFTVDCENLPFQARHVVRHPTMAPVRGAPHPHNIGLAGTPHGPHVEVTPADPPEEPWDGTVRQENAITWLTELAGGAGQTLVVAKLLALFGTLACPNCLSAMSLWESALHERESR